MALQLAMRCLSMGEAAAARSALEAAGVEVFVDDQNMASVDWFYANAIGGVKLFVREEQLERAQRVIAGEIVEPEESGEEEESATPVEPLVCPECGSANIKRLPRAAGFLIAAIVLYAVGHFIDQMDLALAGIGAAALIALFAPSHRCKACNHRWNGVEPEVAAPEAPLPIAADLVEQTCPRCGSPEFHLIDYRRLKALSMVTTIAPFLVVPVWLFKPKKRCDACGLEL